MKSARGKRDLRFSIVTSNQDSRRIGGKDLDSFTAAALCPQANRRIGALHPLVFYVLRHTSSNDPRLNNEETHFRKPSGMGILSFSADRHMMRARMTLDTDRYPEREEGFIS